MASDQDPPALDELLACASIVAIPTRTRFRGIAVREAVLFDAPNGASEFSPFPEYYDAEAAHWLAAAIEFGWGRLPSLQRDRIAINATIPAVSADAVPEVLARFPGSHTAKVKVAERGQSLADDIERVSAVRTALGSDALIRVDANGAWSVDEAEHALRALAEFGLDYAEQPCATVPELVELRRRLASNLAGDLEVGGSVATHDPVQDGDVAAAHGQPKTDIAANKDVGKLRPLVRIAADEGVRKAGDPLAVARAGAADLLVIKAQPLGGITRSLDVVAQAGLPVVVSSALDTSVGISMGLHLAAALPDGVLAGACGLGTAALLDGDVTADPLLPRNGELVVRRPSLAAELLSRYAAPRDRATWWRDRIARSYALLGPRKSTGR